MKLILLKALDIGMFWCCMFVCVVGAVRISADQQKTNTMLELPARVVSIYDGDTVTLEFNVKANVRLLDCWAPEIKTKDQQEKLRGVASKKYLEGLLKINEEVSVRIPFDGNISNSVSLSRILGSVYKDVDGDGIKDNISDIMTKQGYATKTKEN